MKYPLWLIMLPVMLFNSSCARYYAINADHRLPVLRYDKAPHPIPAGTLVYAQRPHGSSTVVRYRQDGIWCRNKVRIADLPPGYQHSRAIRHLPR